MRLVVTAYMTLDGVVEAPGLDEHRDGRNAWALRIQTEEDLAYNEGQIRSAEALLLAAEHGRSGLRSGRRRRAPSPSA
jgi:hypothetical protein